MKDIDELLRRHAETPKRQLHKHFTKNVIAELIPGQKPSWRSRLQEFYMRFIHLPKYAAIALAVIAFSGLSTGAYAAFRWLNPKVTVTNITQSNDDHRRQYTIDAQCGTLDSKSYKYELQQNSTLGNDSVYQIFKNTCEYKAVQDFATKTYRSDNTNEDFATKKPGDTTSIYDSTNIFAGAGDANKVFGLTTGTVTQITDKNITIQTRLYQIDSVRSGPSFVADGKVVTATLPLLGNVQAWNEGKAIPLQAVQVGDVVQLVKKTVYPLDETKHLMAPSEFGVAGIIKTSLDTTYIYNETLGNPAFIGQIADLGNCHNNPDFLCPAPLSQRLSSIYEAMKDGDTQANNNLKYRRADVKQTTSYWLSGRVQSISDNTITIKTRGTVKTATIVLPYDAVTKFNQSQHPTVGVGDLVEVIYSQKSSENHLKIEAKDLSVVSLVQHMTANGQLQNY